LSIYIAPIRNRNLQISKAPLKSQAQGKKSLFTGAASKIREVVQRIEHSPRELRSGCQRVRGEEEAGAFYRLLLSGGCRTV